MTAASVETGVVLDVSCMTKYCHIYGGRKNNRPTWTVRVEARNQQEESIYFNAVR
jgi:hypothetical protein